MKYRFLIFVGLILFLAGCQGSSGEWEKNTETGMPSAHEQRGALVLYKEPLYEFTGGRRAGSVCDGLYDVASGKDVPDMRNFPYFDCEGRYTLTLAGQKGTTVSLFGKFKYQKENGFMVIVKSDNRKLWVINLDSIPRGKWVSVAASRDTGAYEVYFKGTPQFSQGVSSVKWGQWWQGDPPE
jgi:hypothetical protein